MGAVDIGVVIVAADETQFRVGEYIESHGLVTPPTKPKTTYIVHQKKVTKDDVLRWVDDVAYRLVFITGKAPEVEHDNVIIDRSLTPKKTKSTFGRMIDSILRWTNRDRTYANLQKDMLTNSMGFMPHMLHHNRGASVMDLIRLQAKIRYTLPEDYAVAAYAFGVMPLNVKTQWPPRKKKKESERPPQFRESDVYWAHILAVDSTVRNEVRLHSPDVDAGIKKTPEGQVWI
jgi:hypothetical protein